LVWVITSSFAPHYFEVWQAKPAMAYPNDFMWIACGMGIVGIRRLYSDVAWDRSGNGSAKDRSGGFLAAFAFLAVLIYLWIGFSGEPRHALALVYFTLMVLVLALPLGRQRRESLPPRYGRHAAVSFFLWGAFWMFGSADRLIRSQRIDSGEE
jgi:hypothetical protein